MYAAEKDRSGAYNVSSRGRQLSTPKCKPGISPLIFTDFLLDKTVFLDITDMSKYLPPLKEQVVLVDHLPEEENMFSWYRRVIDTLNTLSQNGYGMTVLSTMLQFALSYLDKPYGMEPIYDPLTENRVLVSPNNFEQYSTLDCMTSKETKLIEIVESELREGRNCFVFAEYTASPSTCATGRLKELIEHRIGLKSNEVVILESTSVTAQEREEWIHKKAEEGMKVCIVNPKCVETGLDFCFDYNNRYYNYPTLIFYQMGYSLFTIWQASRRHYRLNQRTECRTYYMGYRGTIQETVIELIAKKMSATSAIQGKFSAEGLSAMAQGVDTRLQLAQALSTNDVSTGNNLQDMFDVINQTESEDGSIYTPMKLFSELMCDVAEEMIEEAKDSGATSVIDISSLIEKAVTNVAEKNEGTVCSSMLSFLFGKPVASSEETGNSDTMVEQTVQSSILTTTKRKRNIAVNEGQISIFNMEI